MSTNYVITTEFQKAEAIKAIQRRNKYPFTCVLKAGKPRTVDQNKLQRKWMLEAQEQSSDTAEYWRGYCKLHFGIPILRNSDADFKREYDEIIRPMDYENKMRLMQIPFDFAVTRKMTTVQTKQYLDEVFKYFTVELGFFLTDPSLKGYDNQ